MVVGDNIAHVQSRVTRPGAANQTISRTMLSSTLKLATLSGFAGLRIDYFVSQLEYLIAINFFRLSLFIALAWSTCSTGTEHTLNGMQAF